MDFERPLRTWEVPQYRIDDWESLYPDSKTRNDCAANVLAFLGVIDIIKGKELSDKVAESGMTSPQILEEIYKSVSIDSEFKENHKIGQFLNIDDIYTKLGEGKFTIAMCFSYTNMGHAIVITKHKGVIYVIDPQNCSFQRFDEWWNTYESKLNLHYIQTIYTDKKARKREETTVKLRKEDVNGEQPPKRRRTYGGKHKKSIKKNTKKKRTQKKH